MSGVESGETREDDDHYMYEALLQAVYGTNVFDWINKTENER